MILRKISGTNNNENHKQQEEKECYKTNNNNNHEHHNKHITTNENITPTRRKTQIINTILTNNTSRNNKYTLQKHTEYNTHIQQQTKNIPNDTEIKLQLTIRNQTHIRLIRNKIRI